MNDRLSFASDYLEGAHPSILKRLADTNWQKLLEQQVAFSFWEKYDETHTIIRFATSWATQKQDVDQLCKLMRELA